MATRGERERMRNKEKESWRELERKFEGFGGLFGWVLLYDYSSVFGEIRDISAGFRYIFNFEK